MTKEEAISIIKSSKGYVEAKKMAIEALKKQIPQKPIEHIDDTASGELVEHLCPVCDYEVFSDNDYCPSCGQRLDWY